MKTRETNARYIELAIKILSETPSEKNLGLREWATKTIDLYSEIKFDPKTIAALQTEKGLPSLEEWYTVPIIVHFYNSTNIPGLGEDTADYLGRFSLNTIGFTGFSHYEQSVKNSFVIDRQSNSLQNGLLIAELLGIDPKNVRYDPGFGDAYSNVKVVLGDDYSALKPYRKR